MEVIPFEPLAPSLGPSGTALSVLASGSAPPDSPESWILTGAGSQFSFLRSRFWATAPGYSLFYQPEHQFIFT